MYIYIYIYVCIHVLSGPLRGCMPLCLCYRFCMNAYVCQTIRLQQCTTPLVSHILHVSQNTPPCFAESSVGVG